MLKKIYFIYLNNNDWEDSNNAFDDTIKNNYSCFKSNFNDDANVNAIYNAFYPRNCIIYYISCISR